MNTNNSVEALAIAICDRICLNNDLYVEFVKDPPSLVNRYVLIASEQAAVLERVNNMLDKARLKAHWDHAVACACRDIAVVIPD